jgi:hypothetical protein
MQTADIAGLAELFYPVEFHPLKPIVLLLGWEYCSDVQTARDVLDVLWNPQVCVQKLQNIFTDVDEHVFCILQ